MAREKITGFYFKMSPAEWDMVEKRMAQTNITNKSAYLRKMAIDGHVIILDTKTITEIGRLLRITSNNVNQLAKRVNSGGEAYRVGVAEVNEQLTEIRKQFGDALTALDSINNIKPGKLFLLPPKAKDFHRQHPPT